MMKATYIIKQKASYVEIYYTAQTEADMIEIVKLLSVGKPKDTTDKYEVTVSVEFTEAKAEGNDNF